MGSGERLHYSLGALLQSAAAFHQDGSETGVLFSKRIVSLRQPCRHVEFYQRGGWSFFLAGYENPQAVAPMSSLTRALRSYFMNNATLPHILEKEFPSRRLRAGHGLTRVAFALSPSQHDPCTLGMFHGILHC